MAEHVTDPGGDALRFTFDVADKATARLKTIEKSFGHAVSAVSGLETRLKGYVKGVEESVAKSTSSILNFARQHLAAVSKLKAAPLLANVMSDAHVKQFEAHARAAERVTEDWVDHQIELVHDAADKIVARHDALQKRLEARRTATPTPTEEEPKSAPAKVAKAGLLATVGKNLASGFGSVFKEGIPNPEMVQTAVLGVISEKVGEQTLKFDDALSRVRRTIGQTNAEYRQYRDTIIEVGRRSSVSTEDMVALADTLAHVGRSAVNLSGTDGIGAATEAYEKYNKAAGFDEDQARGLVAMNLQYFGQTKEGLERNEEAWSEISKYTTLTHEEMYGLIDAQKISVGLASQYGTSVEDSTKNLIKGADVYKDMGKAPAQAERDRARLAAPTNTADIQYSQQIAALMHTTPQDIQHRAMTRTLDMGEVAQEQALFLAKTVREQGPYAMAGLAQSHMGGIEGNSEALEGQLFAGNRLQEALEKGLAQGKTRAQVLAEDRQIRGQAVSTQQALVEGDKGKTTAVYSAIDEIKKPFTKANWSFIEVMSGPMDLAGQMAEKLATGLQTGIDFVEKFGTALNDLITRMEGWVTEKIGGKTGEAINTGLEVLKDNKVAAAGLGATALWKVGKALLKKGMTTAVTAGAEGAAGSTGAGVGGLGVLPFTAAVVGGLAVNHSIKQLGKSLEEDYEIEGRGTLRDAETRAGGTVAELRAKRAAKWGLTEPATAVGTNEEGGALSSPAAAPYRAAIEAAARKYGLSPEIQARQLEAESHFDPNAVGFDGKSLGLAQFRNDRTGRDNSKKYGLVTEADFRDPIKNIEANAHYMADLKKRFGGDYAKALVAYNTGRGDINSESGTKYLAAVLGKRGSAHDPMFTESPSLVSAIRQQTTVIKQLNDTLTTNRHDPKAPFRSQIATGAS